MSRAFAGLVAVFTVACHHRSASSAQPVASTTPAASTVRLITSDIPNFWRAYDLGAGKDSAERVHLYQTIYLQPGTPGLRDWMRIRLMNRDTVRARLGAAGWTTASMDSLARLPRGTPGRDSLDRAREPLAERSAAEELVHWIGQFPRYYAAVRAATLSLDTSTTTTGNIRRGLSRLAELYPPARFPDVYFLIGTTSTGGTVGRSGMLIGTEQLASGPDTPLEELPEWARATRRASSFANIARLVVHEAVHTQQAPRPEGQRETLLRHAISEGTADFLAELALGPIQARFPRQVYGEAHERAVWLDFKEDLARNQTEDEMQTDSTISTWMYNGRLPADKNHGATDIGYWVGYRIASAYYERAKDKRAAVRELLMLPDPERLLAESGYAEYAEKLPH